jgi:hypothetical protein
MLESARNTLFSMLFDAAPKTVNESVLVEPRTILRELILQSFARQPDGGEDDGR